jgi:hypothetical protein
MEQQFFVFVEKRLALGGIGDHHRDPRPELHRGRESASARAHDPELLKPFGRGRLGHSRHPKSCDH